MPGFLMRMIAQKVTNEDGTLTRWHFSKAKVSAILLGAAAAASYIGPAMGMDIKIPEEVFKVLEAIGIFGLRDAIKPKT